MARRKSSGFEDLVGVVAMLPWWACLILAAVSYVLMHGLASVEIPPPKGLEGFTTTVFWTCARVGGMFGQVLLPAVCTIAAVVSACTRWKRRDLYTRASTDRASVLNDMSWKEFEQLVGEAFRRKGFSVRETGGSGPDGGVDLVLTAGSEKYLVQCKQWRATKVNVKTVRELFGVMAAENASGAFVVTSGEFTSDAEAFVQGRNIELLRHGQLIELVEDAYSKGNAAARAAAAISRVGPSCPACGSAMQQRTARKGANQGKAFWGCRSFPQCRATLPIP
jgi:restriction system protein